MFSRVLVETASVTVMNYVNLKCFDVASKCFQYSGMKAAPPITLRPWMRHWGPSVFFGEAHSERTRYYTPNCEDRFGSAWKPYLSLQASAGRPPPAPRRTARLGWSVDRGGGVRWIPVGARTVRDAARSVSQRTRTFWSPRTAPGSATGLRRRSSRCSLRRPCTANQTARLLLLLSTTTQRRFSDDTGR